MSLRLNLMSAALIGALSAGAAHGAMAAVQPVVQGQTQTGVPAIASDYQYHGQHYAYHYNGRYYHHRRHVNGHYEYY